jgi:hypothetical protein
VSTAQRIVNVMRQAVEQGTENGARVAYIPAVIESAGGAYEASAYVGGDTDITTNIRTMAGQYLNTGDYVVVALDSEEDDAWIAQVLPYSMYSRIALDFSNGMVYTGDGDTPPEDPGEAGMVFTSGGPTASAYWSESDTGKLVIHTESSLHLHEYATSNTTAVFAGQWTQIATGEILSRYGFISGTFVISGGGGGSAEDVNSAEWMRGICRFHIRQHPDFGTNPYVEIEIMQPRKIDFDDFVIIVTSNVGPTTYEIWARIDRANEYMTFTPLQTTLNALSHTWLECQPFSMSLPAGTQFTGELIDMDLEDLTVMDDLFVGDDVFVDDSIRFFPSPPGDYTPQGFRDWASAYYDVEIHRTGTKTLTIDDGDDAAVTVNVIGSLQMNGVEVGAGGAGAPTGADYLVGTANGGLSAEIVVGTTPGGELGGTWASPTVDSNHGGSTHAATQAAAEATAASALSTHTGLPNAHHNRSHDHSNSSDGSTLAPAGLTLPTNAAPAPTAEGEVWWDSATNQIKVGDAGTTTRVFGAISGSNPTTLAFGDAAAPGSSTAVGARDHVHGMPANPVTAHEASYTHANIHTHSSAETFVTAETTISTATYMDITGASVSLAAGTWLLMANITGRAVNAQVLMHCAITDNSDTIITEATQNNPSSGVASVNSWGSVHLSAIVSPGSTTTYKLRGARGTTTHTTSWIASDGSGANVANNASSGSDKGTGIRAIRIA